MKDYIKSLVGQLNCPTHYPIKLCCLMIHTCISVCCTKWCSCILDVTYRTVYGATALYTGEDGDIKHANTIGQTGQQVRRPLYCDGTCQGANQARRQYRKQLRMLKRKGINPRGKLPDVWWMTSYRCTHTVRYISSLYQSTIIPLYHHLFLPTAIPRISVR